MSLLTQPNTWGASSNNLPSTPSTTLLGTAITLTANNVDSSVVSLLTLSHPASLLNISFGRTVATAANTSALADLMIDPAGGTSWSELIADLQCGSLAGIGDPGLVYSFPLQLPSGAALGLRARTAHSANITSGFCGLQAFGNPSRPDSAWSGSGVETIGSTPASSQGTTVTPGNSGSWGSWTNIGSASSRIFRAIQAGIGCANSAMNSLAYQLQIGYGSNQLPGSPTFSLATATDETIQFHAVGSPIWCNIPAGTQLQARAKCSGSAQDLNVILYGVY